MSQASDVELLMLDLINEERTSRGLDPLTINSDLNESSEDHSRSMLDNNSFSHRGVDGSTATERMVDAGYDLDGSWQTGENIGVQSLRGEPGIADDVEDVHIDLMNSPEHRDNILNPNFDEIGIGIELGDFTYDSGARLESVMVTQNFGRTEAEPSVPEPTPEVVVSDTAENPTVAAPSEEAEPQVVETTTVTSGSTTSTSSGTVTATAGSDGVDVEIDGNGNFTAEGTATNGDETVTETDSGGSLAEDAPVEMPVETDTTASDTITNTSSSAVTATAGPDGVDVEIDGDGNFTAEGTATNGDETVNETDSGGSLAEEAPVDDMPMVDDAEPSFDAATFFDQFFDGMDFAGSSMADDGADDLQVVTAFEGTVATPDGTVTTNDPEEFSTFFMEMVMMANMSCVDMMDMG